MSTGLPAPSIEWMEETDSTNAELLRRHRSLPARHALAARRQVAGRGQQGRGWLSPEGNLYLSVFARLNMPVDRLEGLSLAIGMAACRALHRHGAQRAAVKWPNDLQVDGAKLGGVLIEIAGHGPGSCTVVIGLGLNVRMPPSHVPDQSWTDLARLGVDGDLETWARVMTEAICTAVARFEAEGFDAFRSDWDALDALRGRRVEVHGAQGIAGVARGIDAHGALRVEHPEGVLLCRSGDVRVRAA